MTENNSTESLRNELNRIHQKLQKKPENEKGGYYSNSVGSILNCYREGDISFDKAKEVLIEMIRSGSCVEIQSPQ